MKYQHIIFDLDGTLVDSASEIHEAAAHVCREQGLEQPSLRYIREKTGSPPVQFFLDHGCNPADAEQLVASFRQRLADHAGDPECVYPGVLIVLNRINQLGARVSLATTKPTALAALLLERYGLLPYFSHVQGTDPPLKHKPHPDILLACLSHDPALAAVMVGDTVFDMEAASRAGIDAIGISIGAHGRDRLSEAKPAFIIDQMIDLLPAMGCMS
jgi:phosphoglycolate phosphatase-like HAD superfamily hydrolase